MKRPGSTTSLVAAMLLVLAGYGLYAALVFRAEANEREAQTAARKAVRSMQMAVNPGVQVCLLDADGTVADYLGEPRTVLVPRVDLAPVRRFLAGNPLPLGGAAPAGSGPRWWWKTMVPACRQDCTAG